MPCDTQTINVYLLSRNYSSAFKYNIWYKLMLIIHAYLYCVYFTLTTTTTSENQIMQDTRCPD